MNTAGASSGGFFKSAKSEGDGMANGLSIGLHEWPRHTNILASGDDAVVTEGGDGRKST